MKDPAGKTAFVTGAAVGMGFGMAKAFAGAGMKVIVTDVRQDALDKAVTLLAQDGHTVHGIRFDVTDRDAWIAAADEAEGTFGKLHLLCHNVGGGGLGHLSDSSYADWDWLTRLNLRAPINAIHTMLPRIRRHGEGGHIVVTASMTGIVPAAPLGVYSVAKAGVMGLMESLRGELEDTGVGVSVHCPGLVRTSGATTGLRPETYSDTGFRYETAAMPAADSDGPLTPVMESSIERVAMDPDEVGRKVLRGVLRDDLFILPHAEFGQMLQEHFAAILDAMPSRTAAHPPTSARQARGEVTFGAMYKSPRAHD